MQLYHRSQPILSSNPIESDVLVLGLGPAGRALVHRCLSIGLRVIACDKEPMRVWTATYGAWVDELPGWIASDALATVITRPQARAHSVVCIDRPYAIFNTQKLQSSMPIDAATVIAGTVITVTPYSATLLDGQVIRATTVIDARGASKSKTRPAQSAYGLTVSAKVAAPFLTNNVGWFMDWTQPFSTDSSQPSFLYAVPVPGGVLLEETCLVGRPPLSLRELQSRLHQRLEINGVITTGTEPPERVYFPVYTPLTARNWCGRGSTISAFGAKAALMHPGTGYSVATALASADKAAEAVAKGRSVESVLWTVNARLVHSLRLCGLRTLLNLDSEQTVDFFEAFFDIPSELQQAYLSERANVSGTLEAMHQVWNRLPKPLKAKVITSSAAIMPSLECYRDYNS
ncbi:MAG: lycopene cyclase family protein [Mycobacteriaceae bacterium]